MNWRSGPIEGVTVQPLKRFTDARGWLMELFRADEMPAGQFPAMAYLSITHPGVMRGPHEHVDQTDSFAFVGPGTLKVGLWDRRPQSPTRGCAMTIVGGEENPVAVVIPAGVVHGYCNISGVDCWVLNFPNRLFRGKGRAEPVDEIRYEGTEDAALFQWV